jgi:CRISPR-associated protein Cmr3
MGTWIIEPHDSFIARDGRPFGLIAGVRAASLPFPFPSTTTGGVRTREGLDADGVFDVNKTSDVKKLSVSGALLVELDDDGRVTQWLLSAPADALLLDAPDTNPNKATVRRLSPRPPPPASISNLPDGLLPLILPKVKGESGDEHYDKNKPHGYAPHFWKWAKFEDWLRTPGDFSIQSLNDFGISGLLRDQRSHVGIDRDSQTSEQGSLFQTRGLEFTQQKQTNADGSTNLSLAARLALAVSTDATNIKQGVASLGGERRLVSWRAFEGAEDILTMPSPVILKSIVESKACRVVLLTPAHFEQGWRPKWISDDRAGLNGNLKVELRAAAMSRYQVVSGWNFEVPGGPKPTRRLVPAGAVFFLKLQGSDAEIEEWARAVWMQRVSDDLPSRNDGFGLAALGVWPEGKDMN